jgi:hypothetical protein
MSVTDLDAQLVRIRDYRTRSYFSDAVKCFRAGAYRSAVAATWVTVAYDLIAKYRELRGLGDAEATRFIGDWDRARTGNQTAKLLELERVLLAHAHEKLAIIDAMTFRALTRLFEDRHLCAHPAFATQDDLYEPPPDLVRAHMTVAVDALLSQRPVQGKSLFEAFSVDLLSPGFPAGSGAVHDYVEHKYLHNMRPHVIRNFGVVLAKSVVRNIPAEWSPAIGKVIYALTGLQQRAVAVWAEIEAELLRLINEDDPPSRPRSIYALSHFPHLVRRLNAPTLAALRQTCRDANAVVHSPIILAASDIAEFRDDLLPRFEALEEVQAATLLSSFAPHALWPSSLIRFARAGSFRGAESRFDQFVLPFSPVLTDQDLDGLFAAIQGNGQIWDAAGIPSRLALLMHSVHPRRPSQDAVSNFYRSLGQRNRGNFEDTWVRMERSVWCARSQPRNRKTPIPSANDVGF